MADGRTVFLVAGEESGDRLGADLMAAIREREPKTRFLGVGGSAMKAQGLSSIFSMVDIAVMGFTAVFGRLPLLVRRIRQTAAAVIEASPDVLVIIDSPDFTHRVARRVRRRRPDIPIVDYVSPTVWVWRPGRARKMRGFVDRLLAILPFEPAVHERLGGPPCTYIGHPLIEKLDRLRPAEGERRNLGDGPPVLLVLPGSRRLEIDRLMPFFGRALGRIVAEVGEIEVLLPAVSHLRGEIEARLADWPVRPKIVSGEDGKHSAFRRAHAALAASGTVTLELALAGIPMAVAYRAEWPLRVMKRMNILLGRPIKLDTMVLANIILGDKAIPEFLDEEVTAESLAATLLPLLTDGDERRRQTDAFARLDALMALPDGDTPSGRAAEIVLEAAAKRGA